MARPKGKLFALLAIFAAIGIVTATGAFTSVSAERTVDVSVEGDAQALLQLQPHNASQNGNVSTFPNGYAETTDGELEITGLDNANLNAKTNLTYVFNISNGGSQEVDVWLERSGNSAETVSFYANSSGNAFGENITINQKSDKNLPTNYIDDLSSGETRQISILVDTTKNGSLSPGDGLINLIEVNAIANSQTSG